MQIIGTHGGRCSSHTGTVTHSSKQSLLGVYMKGDTDEVRLILFESHCVGH